MPRIAFTDLSLRSLKAPSKGQVDYWDRKTPSFGLRVSQGGTKTFLVKRANRRHTLGRFPAMSLQQARAAGRRLLADPYAVHTPDIAFGDALDRFIEVHCSQRNRPSTAKETERILRRNFLPHWRVRPVGALTKHDVSKILDRMLKRPSAANHAFTAARTFFNWCMKRGYLTNSPCTGLGLPAKRSSRSRVLTEAELAEVWHTADGIGYPFGTIVQLLILTGQRRGEIAALDWSFIDRKSRTITIPATLAKNGREHAIPYGPLTAAILDGISRRNSTALLFPARGHDDRSFCGFNKGKAILDRCVPVPPWTLHDLRRTFASGLAALNVRIEVVEKLLNHVSGTFAGVTGVYQRHTYMDEMREAMTLWEDHVAALLGAVAAPLEAAE